SELMIQRNCKNFQVLNSNQYISKNYSVSPQTSTTNANAYAFGNYAYGSATTTSHGGNAYETSRASSSLDVQCVSAEANPGTGIFDSQFMNNSLKEKYKIGEK